MAEEFTKLGTTNENHDPVFDRAALDLVTLAKRLDPDLTFDAGSPTTYNSSGGPGSDVISLNVGVGELAWVNLFEGDDSAAINFSGSVVDTGVGNDRLVLNSGQGRLFWHDISGSDTLVLQSATSLADVAIERLGDWTYVGVKGAQGSNMSASELTNVVMFQDSASPEFVTVAGLTFGIDYIRSLSNVKPDFYYAPTVEYQAPFYGGRVTDLPAFDADGDALTYSVLGVEGVGANASWWFSGSTLYTSTKYNIQDTRMSTVSVSVSDGKLHQDYAVSITWTPDPNSDIDPYSPVRDPMLADDYVADSQSSNTILFEIEDADLTVFHKPMTVQPVSNSDFHIV